MIKQQIPE